MLVTDTIQMRDAAVHAAIELEGMAADQRLQSPESIRERLASLALALRTAAAPLATPCPTPRRLEAAPLPAPTTYLDAIEQVDATVRPLITGLLEAQLGERLHRTIVQVDDALGAGMRAGAEVLAAGRPDLDAIRSLLGHVGSAATAGLQIAMTYPEAAPHRPQMRELLAAIASLRPATAERAA